MTNQPTRAARLRSMVLLLGLLAVFAGATATANALTDDDPAPAATDDPTAPSAPLEGEFLVSGSSTVRPIVDRQAEQFEQVEPGVAIAVEGPGSGDGAKKFCDGDVPIANASRAYKDEEIAICEANGIEYIEIKRGIDGITVISSVDNDTIECVSFNDLYALISEEATGTGSWADANAFTSTWGGQTFPDVPLDIFGPGEESGTFDSFAEIVIDSVAKGKTGLDPDSREFVTTIRPDYNSNPDDNTIIAGIESSQYSLGWVGYAFAQESADAGRAKLLQVRKDDGGDCVTPTPETIAAAEFPIARFLYTYVNADAAENQPGVKEFVDYMLSATGLESVTAVGYIDLSDEAQAAAQSRWTDRVTGRVDE